MSKILCAKKFESQGGAPEQGSSGKTMATGAAPKKKKILLFKICVFNEIHIPSRHFAGLDYHKIDFGDLNKENTEKKEEIICKTMRTRTRNRAVQRRKNSFSSSMKCQKIMEIFCFKHHQLFKSKRGRRLGHRC